LLVEKEGILKLYPIDFHSKSSMSYQNVHLQSRRKLSSEKGGGLHLKSSIWWVDSENSISRPNPGRT
jgi:hypothetical protein